VSRVVCNATPLIYLAKIRRLELLKLLGDVVIPKEVKEEVVDKGKELGENDAYIVEKAIKEGWIKVLDAKLIEVPIKLEKGEEATISLAMNLGVREVLIDDAPARTAARLLELRPKGTIFVLLKALQMKKINFDDFLKIMDDLLVEGFRLREEVYIKAIEIAKKIESSGLVEEDIQWSF